MEKDLRFLWNLQAHLRIILAFNIVKRIKKLIIDARALLKRKITKKRKVVIKVARTSDKSVGGSIRMSD